VVDNARLHSAARIVRVLGDALDSVGVRLVFLPTYSPEFNPCELIFAQVKGFLRSRRGQSDFGLEVVKAFASVSRANVFNYYQKCVNVDAS
jgi:transposase